jgi:hypothetical protein
MAQSKLKTLAELEGYLTINGLLADAAYESVTPGICVNEGCKYIAEVEPDCADGHCESCQTKTVRSAYVLAGII